MVIEATRSMMGGGSRAGGETLVRTHSLPVQGTMGAWEEESLFTCPDRDESGFVPSSR